MELRRKRTRYLIKQWRKKHNKELKFISTNYRKRWRKELLKIIGNKCYICGSTKNICFHEIYGKFHQTSDFRYIINHKEDFVPLCNHHHVALHRIARAIGAKTLHIDWNKVFELLQFLFKSKSLN
jgi:predicted HNH restriction endonuclease